MLQFMEHDRKRFPYCYKRPACPPPPKVFLQSMMLEKHSRYREVIHEPRTQGWTVLLLLCESWLHGSLLFSSLWFGDRALGSCRLCNQKHQGRASCSCTSQNVGFVSSDNCSWWALEVTETQTYDQPVFCSYPWVQSLEERNPCPRERILFSWDSTWWGLANGNHLYNLMENKSHMPRKKSLQNQPANQPITLFRQLRGIL